MPKTIKLQGYEAVVPNHVYKRPIDPIEEPESGKKYPSTQILYLHRYKMPTDNEVVEVIQRAASTLTSGRSSRRRGADKFESIDRALGKLSESYVEAIARGEERPLAHLREHFPRSHCKPGVDYLRVHNVDVSNQSLDEARELRGGEPDFYDELINKIGVHRWELITRLDKLRFPSLSELEGFLAREVRSCDLFEADRHYGDYGQVRAQISELSRVFGKGTVQQVQDTSEKYLLGRAAETVKYLVYCLSEGERRQQAGMRIISLGPGGMGLMLGQLLGGMGGMQGSFDIDGLGTREDTPDISGEEDPNS